jgi:serine phosphatase RsbU (regulator of sigma subunit)
MLTAAHLAGPEALPDMINTFAVGLGCVEALVYLVDLQQQVLVPFLGPGGAADDTQVDSLSVDGTLAGRAFQLIDVQFQEGAAGTKVWIPLLDGAERLGVLAVTAPDRDALERDDGLLEARLRLLASLAAELIMTKTLYGDATVRLRRRREMGMAAEIQWSLLPPLTFACENLAIAAALEPAYEIAGDTIDYAVDAGTAHVAILDGMGHGMQAAQLAVLAVAAHRNARRGGQTLTDMAEFMDTTLHDAFNGEAFTTGIIAELDIATGLLQWINAGHPEPLLLRDGRLVKALDIEPRLPFGLGPIGPSTSPPVIGTAQLEPADRVLFHTDGAVEARSPEGEFFGAEQLIELTTRHLASGLSAPETMRRLIHALLEHQTSQLEDDASLLLLGWRTGNESQFLI